MTDLERGAGGDTAAMLPSLSEVRTWTRRLQDSADGLDDAQRIDLIRALEELKCAAAGTQAELTGDFDASQRALAEKAGVPPARAGRGIASQIALARRESPHQAARHVALATVLRREMPRAYAALRAGRTTEWRSTLLLRETACLSLLHRQVVDEKLAGDPDRLEAMGDRDTVEQTRKLAGKLDAASVAARRRTAEGDRHTTLRPAPDTMTWLGALLPVKDGVAVHAALLGEADRRKAEGDIRSRGAIMADTLVARVLAPHVVTADSAPAVPLNINIVVPDDVLLGSSDAGGWVDGYGEVPGDLLRQWIAAHAEAGVRDWVRRLYVTPSSGALVAMDKRGRRLNGRLATYLRLRDQLCRTPWCGAPIRHLDHVEDAARGGPTSAENAQGLCERCNHAKQARGWSSRSRPGPRHEVETETPTGHRYRSTAPDHGPDRPGPAPPVPFVLKLDVRWAS